MISTAIWCVCLLLRIATMVAFYMGLAQTSALMALAMAVMTTLFVGNVLAEKACLLQSSMRYQARLWEYAPMQQQKW
jgi:hypothetical protein